MALDHLVQRIHDLLRPPHSKRRDDHLAPAIKRPPNHLAQLLVCPLGVFVGFIPIGAFHDQDIGRIGQDGVIDQGQVAPADIAAEPHPQLVSLFFDIQYDCPRAQNMPRIHDPPVHPGERCQKVGHNSPG